MSFNSLSFNQQAHYQQTSSQSRKVTLIEEQKTPHAKQQLISELKSLKALSQELFVKVTNHHDENFSGQKALKEKNDDDTYHRPLPPKMELMKVILEGYFGKEFGELFSELDLELKGDPNNAIQNPNSIQAPDDNTIDIDGVTFNANDTLKVEQWHYHSQSLDYQMSGEFDINGQQLKINYSFSLYSEQSSYSSIEMTAAALKDPLIVQFGDQALGQIKDEHNFDINQDGTLNNLPVFSGDVGYLVYDKNQNLKADNGSELFGPQTGNGFTELAQLDSNKNGFIDKEDEHFEQLYLWQPQKSNSMTSLTEAKIQAISISAIDTPFSFHDTNGNIAAQMRQSSFAISDDGSGKGVHQVDVRI
ncbi:hypothetical protein AADZ91_12310 [Colwelliaceae bacterium 6441]